MMSSARGTIISKIISYFNAHLEIGKGTIIDRMEWPETLKFRRTFFIKSNSRFVIPYVTSLQRRGSIGCVIAEL